MLKTFRSLILLTSILGFFTFLPIEEAKAIDPRVKAIGTMAVYGTASGLLLGAASYAFDAPGRAWAVGASLGLYAGLLFGAYVVSSHHYKKYKNNNPNYEDDYYPDTESSPYEAAGGDEAYNEGYERWVPAYKRTLELRALTIGETPNLNPRIKKGPREKRPNFYINLYNYQF